MSQHGARGRALAGQDAATILAHYYAGTTIGAKDPATTVRVLLLDGFKATADKPLVVTAAAARGRSRGRDDVPGECPADAGTGQHRVDDVQPAGRVGRRHPAVRVAPEQWRQPPPGQRRDDAPARLEEFDLRHVPRQLRIKLTTTVRVI
jgi:hypothetical protein